MPRRWDAPGFDTVDLKEAKTLLDEACVMRPIEPPPNRKVVRIPNLKMARGSDVRRQNFSTAAGGPSQS
jgi:hypothetical protein